MRFKFSKKVIALAATALVMVGAVGAGSAMAYFTTYTDAAGTATVHLGTPPTETEEDVVSWAKHIKIKNTGSMDGMVRVKAFAGSEYDMTLGTGEGWTYNADDEYYYYSGVVAPEGETTELNLPVNVGPTKPEEDTFNVVIIEECAPVIYVDGKAQGDWDRVVMNSEEYK